MLQQNSYFPSRYFSWLKKSYRREAAAELLTSAAVMFFSVFLPVGAVILSALVLVFRIKNCISTEKKSIKKLAVTARIKRLYVTTAFFYVILGLLPMLSVGVLGKVLLTVFVVSALITPVAVFICRFVLSPVESAVSNRYINDAKRILKEHKDLTVIGVTGSYGKTTTKFILSRILSEKYNVLATPGSFNTPMGVVRTVREKMQAQTQVFICEMGAKNVGDIKEICDIVHPDFGIITSVGPQHLETFKTVDNVFKTKFELADAVASKNGKVFVNGDSAELRKRIKDGVYTVYGTENADCTVKNISYGKNGSTFTVCCGGQEIALNTKLLGRHSIADIAGAVAIAVELGVSAKEIEYAVASLKPYEHRLELKRYINNSLLIDDAYNSNPEGCIEAVNVLGSFDSMKKVIITPGLVELGEKENDYNFQLGVAAADICDIIILVGLNRSKPIRDGAVSVGFDSERLFTVASFKEAAEKFSETADNNTVLLIENDLPDNYLY